MATSNPSAASASPWARWWSRIFRWGAVIVLAVSLYALGVWTAPILRPPTVRRPLDDTLLVDPETRTAEGKLQPSGGIVSVTALPGDRIARILVEQNEPVEPDDVLFELASHKDRELELKLARQQLDEATLQRTAIARAGKARLAEIEQQLAALPRNRQQEIELQKLKIEGLVQAERTAQQQYSALTQLNPQLVTVSAQELQRARQGRVQAEAELKAAREALESINRKYEQQKMALQAQRTAIEAETDRALNQVPVGSLKQQVELAELRLERSRVKAREAGVVFRVLANEGDSTGPEPILQLAVGEGVVAVAEVYARDVQTLRDWLATGKPVEARITSLSIPDLGGGKGLTGQLVSESDIAPGVARNTVPAASPRADADRRVVPVHVRLSEKSAEEARKYLGLEVTVQFQRPAGTIPRARP